MPAVVFDSIDPSLVQNARNERPGARDRLLGELYPRLVSYSLRLTRGDSETAQDIAQEAVLRLLRSLADLRDPDRLIPWVFRIATNLWRDRLRGREDLPLTKDVEDSSAREACEKGEVLHELVDHLDALPSTYRIVLTLRFLRGMDYEAMGQILETPQATLRMQVARGIRLLRERIDGRSRP